MIDIKYVEFDKLKVPSWKTTFTLRPELLIISGSLFEYGFIQPIHARLSTGEIIDGSERFLLASQVEEISERCENLVPVVYHDVDLIDAMILHVRLNRGISVVNAEKLSKVVKQIINSRKYSTGELRTLLSMGNEELSVLRDGRLLKHRNIKEHNYAKAWVPIEAPPGKSEKPIEFESPPNKDR